VIDWHYGSVSSIGTTSPTTTTVATPVPTQTVVSSTTAPVSTSAPSTGGGTPYPSAHQAPGRVEAEDYNVGGYFDTTAANEGGAYRNDAVDIEAGGANYNVGWIRAGEYLEYSVDAASAGTYTVSLRVANPGAAKTVKIVTNGASKDLAIPATGSFETWQTAVLNGVSLNAGRNVIRVNMDKASSFNIDYIDLAGGATAQPTPTTSAQTASIKFTSYPAGGSIYLDGAYKGVTPATISGITLGTHRAEIRRTGYQTWVKTIQVTSDFVGRYKPYSYNPTLVKL
jgi:hypothetical protein